MALRFGADGVPVGLGMRDGMDLTGGGDGISTGIGPTRTDLGYATVWPGDIDPSIG